MSDGIGVIDADMRRLIVDFFNLGILARCEICFRGGWLTSADTKTHEGQALWALAFERATQRGDLGRLRYFVDAQNKCGE
ncbi:MAG: hypothetical protein WCK90_00490 [archaeon]